MNYASKLLNNDCEFILALLFIFFLISQTNDEKLAIFVDKPEVKIYVIVVTISLVVFCNKLLGILAIFVAYELLTLSHSLKNVPITTSQINLSFENKSMEEEIVYKMLPFSSMMNHDCLFKPFDNNFGFIL
jgi:hypothetical protein